MVPPIEVVFLRGSEAVGDWLKAIGWERDWGYNSNFKDRQVTDAYEDVFTREYPIYYESDIYAAWVDGILRFPIRTGRA